jgi:hypothetical protein
MSDEHYYTKYLKYKAKYLNLIKQTGGVICTQKPTQTINGKKTVFTCCSESGYTLCPDGRVVKENETEAQAYEKLVNQTIIDMKPPPPAPPAQTPTHPRRDGLRRI